jgi:hypothetical protein
MSICIRFCKDYGMANILGSTLAGKIFIPRRLTIPKILISMQHE